MVKQVVMVMLLVGCQPGRSGESEPSLPADIIEEQVACEGTETYSVSVDVSLEVGAWVEMTVWTHYAETYRQYYRSRTGETWPYGEWHLGRADGFGLDEDGRPQVWCTGFYDTTTGDEGQVWDEVRVLIAQR